MCGFVDADWAADSNDSKSTTGFVIFVRNCAVVWRSVKQRNVPRSSTFAEYYALADCVDEILFVKEVLSFVNFENPSAIKGQIFEDNTGAISIAEKGTLTKKSRHIRVAVDYVKDLILRDEISVEKVESVYNVADILTKALGRTKFEMFRDMLCVF